MWLTLLTLYLLAGWLFVEAALVGNHRLTLAAAMVLLLGWWVVLGAVVLRLIQGGSNVR